MWMTGSAKDDAVYCILGVEYENPQAQVSYARFPFLRSSAKRSRARPPMETASAAETVSGSPIPSKSGRSGTGGGKGNSPMRGSSTTDG